MVCYIEKYVIILAGIFPLTSPQPKYWGDVSPASPAGLTPVPPATENTRPNGADVAGIARYFRARTASRPTSSQANNDALGWFLSPG